MFYTWKRSHFKATERKIVVKTLKMIDMVLTLEFGMYLLQIDETHIMNGARVIQYNNNLLII